MKSKRKKSRRNLFMSTTIMSLFYIGAFSFDGNNIYWMWAGKIQVPIVLGIISIILGTFWFIEQRKLKKFN